MTGSSVPWLADARRPSSAHVIVGAPGIGKSYRFDALLADAAAAGARIMRAQPSEAETRLVGSALLDLCADVTDDEIAALPDVQATALMTALLRASAAVGNPDAVSVAFTGLLRRLADHGPVVIAVDDIQWIDQQTADLLSFAARRMPETGVAVLVARRSEPHAAVPKVVDDLRAALPHELESLTGLPDDVMARLLQERLGAIARADLTAAVDLAGGNPLFGLEIARSARVARERGDTAGRTSLPASLYDAVGRHVAALETPARHALAAAAALRRPQLRQLRELGVDLDLADAERAGLVLVTHGVVTFGHPLYAAAAYDQLAAGERARLHRRLAAVVEPGEEQARHLALSASEPDDAVAAALDAARVRALGRGAVDAALEAARLSVSATPTGSVHHTQRRVALADLLFRTGSTDQSLAELRLAADEAATDRDRAFALYTLAKLAHNSLSQYAGHELAKEALELAGEDLELRADILIQLAISFPEDYAGGLRYAREARELLGRLPNPDPRRLAAAVTNEAGACFYVGVQCDLDALRRVVDLQAVDTTVQVADRAISGLAYVLLWYDDYRGAREAFARSQQMALDEGDEHALTYVLRYRTMLEIRAGRWIEAEGLIDEYAGLAQRCQLSAYAGWALFDRAKLAAYRGDPTLAAKIGDDYIRRGSVDKHLVVQQHGHGLRGLAACVEGDWRRAADELDRWNDIFDTVGAGEPALREYAGDHVEALVLAGRDRDAEVAIDSLVRAAEPLGRTATLAAAARGRALLLAERAEPAAALEHAEHALSLYATIERPLENARAHLVLGQLHRRLRHKAQARRELVTALTTFDDLGSDGFSERARREIDRIGGRASASTGLTETERRVAECAAAGMTSAEIATSLFISPHTVSANLTRVYRKLGIRNRTELATRLASRSDDA